MTTPPQDGLPEPTLIAPDGGPAPSAAGLSADRGRVSAALETDRPSAPATEPRVEVARATPVDAPLADLQAWFVDVMTHPGGFAEALAAGAGAQRALGADGLGQLLRASDRQSAAERLAIYHRAYHSRLVGCVQEDFPAVGHALGSDRFRRVCLAYVHAHPSRSADLNVYAAAFPEFLRARADVGDLDRRALVAVAEFEWAMTEALHAPAGAAFDLHALRAVPPEAWGDLRLRPSPGLFFVESDYPVHAFVQEFLRDEAPGLPAPGWSATAVYRWEGRIWRMGFTRPMAAVLKAILRGAPLGEALGVLEDPAHDAGEADVMRWFSEWVSSGFFEGVETGQSPSKT